MMVVLLLGKTQITDFSPAGDIGRMSSNILRSWKWPCLCKLGYEHLGKVLLASLFACKLIPGIY